MQIGKMTKKDYAEWLQCCVDDARNNKKTEVSFYLEEILALIEALRESVESK